MPAAMMNTRGALRLMWTKHVSIPGPEFLSQRTRETDSAGEEALFSRGSSSLHSADPSLRFSRPSDCVPAPGLRSVSASRAAEHMRAQSPIRVLHLRGGGDGECGGAADW